MKKSLLSMLNPKVNSDENNNTPSLQLFDADNLNQIASLYRFVTRFHRKYFDRSVTFVSIIFVMYALQVIVLFILVLVEPDRLSAAEELFTVNSLFNMGVIVVF